MHGILALFTAIIALGFPGPGAAQVTGRVLENTDGNFLFVPDREDIAVVPLNIERSRAEALSRLPGLALPEGALPTIAESLAGTDLAQEVELPAIAALQAAEEVLRAPRYERLYDAADALLREVESSLTEAATSGADDQPSVLRERMSDFGATASTLILETLNADDGSIEQVNKLVELISTIERDLARLGPPPEDIADQSEFEKAIYAGGREYPPYIYRQIASNTQGVVGIAERTGLGAGQLKPHCSGALVGSSVILTARHCLFDTRDGVPRRRPDGNLKVIFDFESDPAFPFTPTEVNVERVIAMGERDGRPTGEKLDYALLEIARTPEPAIVWQISDAAPSALLDPSRQICLVTFTLQREEEIYVVGHPQSRARAVADSGKVLFPYRVDESALGLLTKRVLEQLHAAAVAEGAESDRLLDLYRRWTESYVETPKGSGTYIHNSAKFGGQPTLGIQSNTFGGNSGGPVFSKLYNHMVGLFRGGAFDFQRELVPGWEFHEAALPIERVILDLNDQVPGWQEQYKVCAWGSDNQFRLWSGDPNLLEHCSRVCR